MSAKHPKSVIRLAYFSLLVWICLAPVAATAEEILDYLPEDALGFVLVRDIHVASRKCERLMQMFGVDSPAPLLLVNLTTHLGEGLDMTSDFLAALLPGPRGTDAPEPLVILPVADYAKFAASVNGDESGEVCRITIAGEDVLVAKHGPYAMLMNVEHRETLDILIGLEPAPVNLVKPWKKWLETNETTLAILPPGVEKLLALGQQGLAQQRQQWLQEYGDPEFADLLAQLQQSLAMYQAALDLFGGRVKATAIGMSLSDSNDLRVGLRLLTEAGLPNAALAPQAEKAHPLLGYPDKPYVFAGGGAMSTGLTQSLMMALIQLMKRSPEAYGYQEFDEAAWKDIESTYIDLAKAVRAASVMMQTGKKGDALFGNIYGILNVERAAAYLATYKQAAETWNRLAAESTSDVKMQYEVADLKIGNAEACEVVVDVAAAARDPNVPMLNWMLESMFGPEGKLRILLVAADENTVIVGIADEEQMTKAVELVTQQEQGLQNSADVQTTDMLLNSDSLWKFYVSPHGCVTWFQRWMNELFNVMAPNSQLPEYPTGPPVGASLHLDGAQAGVDVVWPAQALVSLADYLKK